mgnify:CR=1 FL=1
MRSRALALMLLLIAIAAGWWWLGGDAIDIDALRQLKAILAEQVQRRPIWAALAFVVSYLLVAALALPGALILTLLGGALFGFAWGVVLVVLGSSLGALLSFSLVRLIAGPRLRERLASRLAAVARGIERSGGYYLFTLRVVPVFPFFMVNVLVALTPIPVATFYWVSVVGMLPATLIYVNAGQQLAHLTALSGLLSPGLAASLLLLGVFPLLARAIVPRLIERIRVWMAIRRSDRTWRAHRPARFDRDLIVIGDADLFDDSTWLQADQQGGKRAIADNGPLVFNALETLVGDRALADLRSRGQSRRPFTRVEGMRKEAEGRYFAREQELQKQVKDAELKVAQLQREGASDGGRSGILTPEQAKALEDLNRDVLQARAELRGVQLQLRSEVEQIGRAHV